MDDKPFCFSEIEEISIFPKRVNSDTLKEMGIYPIFDRDGILRGTGFFIKNIFITAAHILKKSFSPLAIKVGSKYHKLPGVVEKDTQYSELVDNANKRPVDIWDIACYLLHIEGVGSLKFEDADLDVGDNVSKFGYGNCGDGISADYETKLYISESNNPKIIINSEHSIIAQNCYEVTSKSCYNVILPSNSGSPLIRDGKVCGMVIRSYEVNKMVGHAIKASYIKSFIDNK